MVPDYLKSPEALLLYIKNTVDYDPAGRYIFSRNNVWDPRDKSGLMLVDLKPGPYAVWYGYGSHMWLDWMRAYNPSMIKQYNALFKIEVDRDQVLKLDTPENVIEFNRAFSNDEGLINWNAVATQYIGVEFVPYFQQLRADLWWYKNLSIASGVIFDPVNGITNAKLVWKR